MKTIDLNFDVLHLNGNKFGNAGEILGQHLVADTKGAEALKFYDWAVALTKGNKITIDNADFKKVKEFIENHAQLPILFKAPVLKYLDTVEENKE